MQDVTTVMLESARKKLRDLVHLIDKKQRQPVYADFEDMLGDATEIELPEFATAESFEKFRVKAQEFLKAHKDHMAINKLRLNKQLTPTDLDELEQMLVASGVGGGRTSNALLSAATAWVSLCAR